MCIPTDDDMEIDADVLAMVQLIDALGGGDMPLEVHDYLRPPHACRTSRRQLAAHSLQFFFLSGRYHSMLIVIFEGPTCGYPTLHVGRTGVIC